jgi:DNA-binding LacI/PurR family transcriptional regulator
MTERRIGPGARALLGVGLTQGEVARAAGLSQKHVSRVLRGDAPRETTERVLGAITALGGIAAAAQVAAAVMLAEQDERDR